MEIVCNQLELNNAIQLVSKAVASRPTHPILANILLTADQGTNKISLTGFDLNLEYKLLLMLQSKVVQSQYHQNFYLR